MIDFHNHVLPNVDDGPKTLEESMSMIRHAASQGITDIVQTVHFQHPKMEGKNTSYNYLNNQMQIFQKAIDQEQIKIKMHLSAEVFYLPNLLDIVDNPLVTFGNRKYMLIEFKTNIFPTGYENEFYKLQCNGVNPIIAHPERYRFIQENINILDSCIKRGYVIQVDASSIIGGFGSKIQKIVFSMLDKGFIHLIGSDAHNSRKRNFCLRDAYSIIEKKYSEDSVNKLKKNVEKIKLGEEVLTIDFIEFKKKSSFLKEIISRLIKLLK